MNTVKRLWAWLTNGELVWLKDHDGETTLAIAYKTPFGDRIAERYWPTNSVLVLLKDDGTTAGTHYVDRWMPANKHYTSHPPHNAATDNARDGGEETTND